jgi:hypothetical protein
MTMSLAEVCTLVQDLHGKKTGSRDIFRLVIKALVASGKDTIEAGDTLLGVVPGSPREKTAWLKADAEVLGGRWVKGRQVVTGRGPFGRYGGGSARSGYYSGYFTTRI